MHLELRHLRTIRAIEEYGGLARAAERLHITQSALSHQLKALEDQAGVELVVRRAKPLKLSAAGHRLLRLAYDVLPLVEAAEAEFRDVEQGRAGRLHITLECHHCIEWLLPVMGSISRAWPDVDLDIRSSQTLNALRALSREEVDVVITADPEDLVGIDFVPLFDYAPTLVCAANNPLADKPEITPEDFATQTLITYPVDHTRLDVFSQFLDPAGVAPAAIRQVEQTQIALMLVASGRGVAVMPDWVLRLSAHRPELAVRSLGLHRRLFAAIRHEDISLPYIAHALRLARTEPIRLMRAPLGIPGASA